MELQERSKNKRLALVIGFVALLIIAIVIGAVVIANSPSRRFQKELDLGNHYLEDLDYEKAVAAFLSAVEIDPMSEEAYLGLAKAYEGLGDKEKMREVLEKGYAMTQSTVIAGLLENLVREQEPKDGQEEQNGGTDSGSNTLQTAEEPAPEKRPVTKYSVKDFTCRDVEDVRQQLEENEITLQIGEGVYDDVIPKGKIVSQDIAPGSVIESGSGITVHTSLGLPMITVPDLIGKQQKDAEAMLDELHLKHRVSTRKTPDAEDGTILEQSTPANSEVEKFSEIALVAAKKVRVAPDLRGMTPAEAQEVCGEMGIPFQVVDVLGNEGSLVSQYPSAGTFMELGDTLQLQVGISAEVFREKLLEAINARRAQEGSVPVVFDDQYQRASDQFENSELGIYQWGIGWANSVGQGENRSYWVENWMVLKHVTTISSVTDRLPAHLFYYPQTLNKIGITILEDRVCTLIGYTEGPYREITMPTYDIMRAFIED